MFFLVIVYNDCVVWSWVHSSCLPYFSWKFGKLEKKNLDMIVANNVKVQGAGFGTDTNVVTIITKDGVEELPMMSKEQVADQLLGRIINMRKTGGKEL